EWNCPFILECSNADVLAETLDLCKARRPLIYAADDNNIDSLASLSKSFGCPLAIKCIDVNDAVTLVEKAKAAGAEDLVLDLGSKNLKECLERQTIARRSALKKKFKPLGYPLMNRVGSGEYAIATAVISTLKYGSLVIFDDLNNYEALPLFTLRQNIYTDPQVPIQVKQGLYPIGNPNEHSPIMFTTNFSLTYFTVRADIEKSKIPVWLQIVNTEGLSVLTAYAAGKFDPEHVKEALDESDVLNKSDGIVIVPGLVSRMSGKLQELIKRDVTVGTTESKNIPKHLKEIIS
ncbi:MAG: acetyl-CoA decarbonylase/synthase complex subunit gamma, partial [Candidatus Methanomethylophilaceae archaeon]